VTSGLVAEMMAGMDEVEVVVAHSARATLRVGDLFLKVDAYRERLDLDRCPSAVQPTSVVLTTSDTSTLA
jgi:hypothetical protein